MHKVRIESNGSEQFGTKVFVDNQRVEKLEGVNFSFALDSIPEITISTRGVPDIDVLAEVKLDPSPQNVQVACQIVANELGKRGAFYDAFVASILSVIKPYSRYIGDGESEIICEYGENHLAEEIVNRIIGEE